MSSNVDFIARCIAGSAEDLAKTAVNGLGGMQLMKISKEDYDSIEHDQNTLYFVVDGDKVTQYLGDNKLSMGFVTIGETYSVAKMGGTYKVGNLSIIEG